MLFENANTAERLNHLGVEVFDQKDVADATSRFVEAGIAGDQEIAATCCFATQDKIWSEDPQGARWKWYKVLEDSETFFGKEEARTENAAPIMGCC